MAPAPFSSSLPNGSEPPPLKPSNENRIDFHMAEFSALKSEIAELVKVASSNLQYALAVSGVITAWLVSARVPTTGEELLIKVSPEYLRYVFFLPLLLSIVFGLLALAAYFRIGEKVRYLQSIEDELRAKDLGWERRFKARPRTLARLYTTAWFGLNVFVASFAFW